MQAFVHMYLKCNDVWLSVGLYVVGVYIDVDV